MLPNPLIRLCTQHLKIEAMRLFILRELRLETWTTATGIRYDEPRRWGVQGQDKRNRREFKVCPLIEARVTEDDVMAFWARQPFDLGLRQGEGNCDLCFLKRSAAKEQIIRERPDLAEWWMNHEHPEKGSAWLWRKNGRTYRKLAQRAKQSLLVLEPGEDDGLADCACTD